MLLRRIRSSIHPGPLATLVLVWVMLWGDISLGTVVAGALLGMLVLVVFPMPQVSLGLRIRPWPFLILTTRFLWDIVTASVQVAYQVTAPWVHPRSHFLKVQLTTTHDLFRTLNAEMCSLVPGTLVVDVDPETGILLLHVLDADDAGLKRMEQHVLAQERRLLRALAATPSPSGSSSGRPDRPKTEQGEPR